MSDTSGTAQPSPPPAGRYHVLRSQTAQTPTAPEVAPDILYGAEDIAQFLFGNRKLRRRVYNLVERNELPIFRIGMSLCARKSVLLQWIEAQERAPSGTPCIPQQT